jgi:hypothetical protein
LAELDMVLVMRHLLGRCLEFKVAAKEEPTIGILVDLEVEGPLQDIELSVRDGVQVLDHLVNLVADALRLEVLDLSWIL